MPFVRRHHVGCVPLGHDELTLTTDDLGPRPQAGECCEPGPFSTLHGVVFDVLSLDPAVVNSRRVMQAGTTGDQIALPAILTINAISAVLNTNEMMPCTVAVRRMILSVMPTSETCAVIPITNEK